MMAVTKPKKIITIFVLVVLAIAVAFYKYHDIVPNGDKTAILAPTIAVTTTVVKLSDLVQTIQTNAHISAINTIVLHPKIAGYITQILVHEGQFVQKGNTLMLLDHASEQQDLAQKQSALTLAKANYTRARSIKNTGAVSQESLETLKAAYQAAVATYKQSADALADKIIKAPFSGTIGSISLSIGDYVTEATRLTTLTDLMHLRAAYNLAAHYTSIVHQGSAITLSPTTDAQLKQPAIITYKSPTINPNTQTFTVHADFMNTHPVLFPGEAAIVTQPLFNNPKAIVIPAEAVMTSLAGNSVYVIEHSHAVLRTVKLGLSTHSGIQIKRGLNVGDRIILSTGLVRSGSKVSWQ